MDKLTRDAEGYIVLEEIVSGLLKSRAEWYKVNADEFYRNQEKKDFKEFFKPRKKKTCSPIKSLIDRVKNVKTSFTYDENGFELTIHL